MSLMTSQYVFLVDVYASGGLLPDADDILTPPDPDNPSFWIQDPVSGEVIFDPTPETPDSGDENRLVKDLTVVYPGLESTPGTIMAKVEGILEGGIRVAGTTQRFSEIYENVDWVEVRTDYPLRKGHVITNVRYRHNMNVGWREEEIKDYPPTSFVVMGLTPVSAPFVGVLEYKGLAQRRDPQAI